MRPANASTSTGFRWNSPIPYLFGGLAAMFGLIAFALLILACSYRNSRNNSSQEQKSDMSVMMASTPMDMEPKVVVIMAGDDQPTFLAKPSSTTQDGQDK
ncbi:protein GLUTAMINE DUMPER 5-like protein [Cinnamomum micranthum f. kanehirae]|uniref:Protein GLUTAMINE DUMPER 5-like protein n=1 Tax=Cinnamomum micranthum f. kanehirae TaxID=337451 RepID=A0A443NET7_9MAGN|nr:protein GLUTAMINE DUMPER 5-like protein [Cinnamomum micranthum f. kanehirae]